MHMLEPGNAMFADRTTRASGRSSKRCDARLPKRAPVSQTGNAVHPPASPHGVFSASLDMTKGHVFSVIASQMPVRSALGRIRPVANSDRGISDLVSAMPQDVCGMQLTPLCRDATPRAQPQSRSLALHPGRCRKPLPLCR